MSGNLIAIAIVAVAVAIVVALNERAWYRRRREAVKSIVDGPLADAHEELREMNRMIAAASSIEQLRDALAARVIQNMHHCGIFLGPYVVPRSSREETRWS